jgi:hypothetical protein
LLRLGRGIVVGRGWWELLRLVLNWVLLTDDADADDDFQM